MTLGDLLNSSWTLVLTGLQRLSSILGMHQLIPGALNGLSKQRQLTAEAVQNPIHANGNVPEPPGFLETSGRFLSTHTESFWCFSRAIGLGTVQIVPGRYKRRSCQQGTSNCRFSSHSFIVMAHLNNFFSPWTFNIVREIHSLYFYRSHWLIDWLIFFSNFFHPLFLLMLMTFYLSFCVEFTYNKGIIFQDSSLFAMTRLVDVCLVQHVHSVWRSN